MKPFEIIAQKQIIFKNIWDHPGQNLRDGPLLFLAAFVDIMWELKIDTAYHGFICQQFINKFHMKRLGKRKPKKVDFSLKNGLGRVPRDYKFCGMKNLIRLLAIFIFASSAMAGDITWKTFEIKTGPIVAVWDQTQSSTMGWSLELVKPITPYVGVGAMIEGAFNASGCDDCVDYRYDELSEGLLVNMNVPFGLGFGLVSNFMFLVNFQDGTVDGLYFTDPYPVDAYDADGNPIRAYRMREDNHDYYNESFMFRSNLGVSWWTPGKRFGLEFYPLDIAVIGGDARMTFSLDAVVRLF